MTRAMRVLILLAAWLGPGGRPAPAQLEEAWVARYTPAAGAREEGLLVAADAEGNVYVAGTTEDPSPDGGNDYATIKLDALGTKLWARSFYSEHTARPKALAVDGSGGILVTGEWDDDDSDCRFGTLRYAPDGTLLWERKFNGLDSGEPGVASTAAPSAMAADAAGNAYVTGASPAGSELESEFVTVKYAADGEERWVAAFGGPGHDEACAIAIDGAGRIHVAGTSAGPLDARFAVVTYDAAGGELDAAFHDEEGQDLARALAVDADGNAWLTGSSSGPGGIDFLTVLFDPAGNVIWSARHGGTADDYAVTLVAAADRTAIVGGVSGGFSGLDYEIVKYDPSGNEMWTSREEGPGEDTLAALAIDREGNLLAAGSSVGASGSDYLSIKYDPDGKEIWRVRLSRPGSDIAGSMALDLAGNVHVTGSSEGAGGSDILTVSYDASGAERWSARHEVEGLSNPTAIAVSDDGAVHVTGVSNALRRFECVTVKYGAAGDLIWQARSLGHDLDDPVAIALDDSRNVVVAGPAGLARWTPDGRLLWAIEGRSFADVEASPSGYVHVAGTAWSPETAGDFLVSRYAPDGSEAWSLRYDGAGGGDEAEALVLDLGGNVIVTGASEGGRAIVKYDPEGRFLWAAREPGGTPAAIAIDRDGNVAITAPSAAVYGPSGDRLWGASEIRGRAVAFDRDGNVYVAGQQGVVPAAAKYSPGGALLWLSTRLLPGEEGFPTAIAVAPSGDVFIAGIVTGADGRRAHQLMRFDPGGVFSGEARVGPASAFGLPSLALDLAGNAHLAAGIEGSYVIVKYATGSAADLFLRGDSTADGEILMNDPIHTLNYLFIGGPAPPCQDAADANDDGELNLTDAVRTLGYLFLGDLEPPPPGPAACGPDPSADELPSCSYSPSGCP